LLFIFFVKPPTQALLNVDIGANLPQAISSIFKLKSICKTQVSVNDCLNWIISAFYNHSNIFFFWLPKIFLFFYVLVVVSASSVACLIKLTSARHIYAIFYPSHTKKVFVYFQDFSRLLQSLAVYDVCYLVLNLPAFVVPALSGDDINNSIIHAWPYISPLLQICLTGVFLTAKAVLENSLTPPSTIQ